MLITTVSQLKCPQRGQKKKAIACGGTLELFQNQENSNNAHVAADKSSLKDIRSGQLNCQKCRSKYPVLAGVAIVVQDVRLYLLTHVKGIARAVPDSEIPGEFLNEFLEAKTEIEPEHIEEDLEAERVNALYVMNHYLRVSQPNSQSETQHWWMPRTGVGSPLIDNLVREHWDRGPISFISTWLQELALKSEKGTIGDVLEIGCGVGGLYSMLKPHLTSYLGVDSSFASIALARHLALGAPYHTRIKIPEDLLQGPISRVIKLPKPAAPDGRADFIVGELDHLPVRTHSWDISIALNAIDMLEQPESLPALQADSLKEGGLAIQSCPYIWHEMVARKLRSDLPPEVRGSAQAVEWLYQQSGFAIEEKVDHLPWLFFKHIRQLEIYSVHLFKARKTKT